MKSVRGFSTVELLVVLAIVGILAAMTAPNLQRWSSGLRLSAFVREMASALQLARVKAIAHNTSITVCFYQRRADFPQHPDGFFSIHPDSTRWCEQPPLAGTPAFAQFAQTVKGLPLGLTVTPPADNRFTFNSRGQVNSQHLDLSNQGANNTKRITLLFTGRLRIQTL